MGFPVQHTRRLEETNSSLDEGPQVSPATLAFLSRSLPPDKLRILLTTLFETMSSRQQRAVGHVLIGTIPVDERVSELLKPRTEEESVLPAERVWANEQVEKSLAEGTEFTLVPALSFPRSIDVGQNGPANLRWVWRSNTGIAGIVGDVTRSSGSTQTDLILGRRIPSGANRQRLGLRILRAEQELAMQSRFMNESGHSASRDGSENPVMTYSTSSSMRDQDTEEEEEEAMRELDDLLDAEEDEEIMNSVDA
jgi:hypothetical protein